MLGHAGKALAQIFLLGGHPHRAVVGVADAGHDAALGDHRHGAKSVFLSAQQGGDDHVPAGFEAAVGAQQHPITQAIFQQTAVHLGEAQLPGTAGVLDRAERRGAGAAVVAGDLNHISVGLGHTGSDRADADLGHQLHAHLGGGMHLVQVVDQLGQILNRIDVVVGRRRDQGHAGLAVAQPGDVGIHLRARQLAALARLGPLGHLDLQLPATAQIGRRDAKTA